MMSGKVILYQYTADFLVFPINVVRPFDGDFIRPSYLGVPQAAQGETPPYLRVLGANEGGRALLREMKGRAALPVFTKPAHGRGEPLLELEARCTDFYQLCRREPGRCGLEWTTNPVML